MIARPRQGRGVPAADHQGVGEHLVVALPDLLMPEGHPAGLAVAAGPVLAEAMQKGPSQPAAALEFQVQMVGSIAQTKRTRKSARPIALELVLGFPAQPNPARKIFSAHEGDLWAAVRPSQAGALCSDRPNARPKAYLASRAASPEARSGGVS
jgi:hypothetical protein